MATRKQYSKAVDYEKKLVGVMQRIGAESYNYDWTRTECWIEFTLGGQLYRFEHSLQKATDAGQKLSLVSDCFAQLVITLEDISRMSERGIYKLSSWIEGMKALPPPKIIPPCFAALGFVGDIPTEQQVKERYRALAKVTHPDKGGTADAFAQLTTSYEACLQEYDVK